MSKERIEAALQQTAEGIDAMLPRVGQMSPYNQRYFEQRLREYEFLEKRLKEVQ